jgi:hypothetical protein
MFVDDVDDVGVADDLVNVSGQDSDNPGNVFQSVERFVENASDQKPRQRNAFRSFLQEAYDRGYRVASRPHYAFCYVYQLSILVTVRALNSVETSAIRQDEYPPGSDNTSLVIR